MLVLTLSILLPLLLFFCSLFFIVKLIKEKKIYSISNSGKSFFQLDIDKRQILYYKKSWNKVKNIDLLKISKTNQFISLTKLTDFFIQTPGASLIRNLLWQLSQGSKYEFIKFKIHNSKKNQFLQYSLSTYKLQNYNMFLLIVSWKHLPIQDLKRKINYQKLVRDKILQNSQPFKAFVALNLNKYNEKIEKFLCNQIITWFKIKHLYFFYYRGMFIIVFFNITYKKIYKQISFFLNKMKTLESKIIFNHFYNGSGVFVKQNINTVKNFNHALHALEYNIFCSIKLQKDFVELREKLFTKNNYKIYTDYVKNQQSFRQALRIQDISTQKIAVKSYLENKKTINYVFPSINNVENKNMIAILKNPYNRKLLINKHAEIIINKQFISKFSILLNVYDDWFQKNIEKLPFKKIIYVISFFAYNEILKLHKIIQMFLSKGLIFAIRLNNVNNKIITLIKKLNPPFIVIDNKMTKKNDLYTFFQLLSLKKSLKFLNVKIIYENPINYNEEQKNKLEIEYYYNFSYL